MRDIFHSPFFLSVTIGIPFCIFKILFGLLAIRIGELKSVDLLILFGYPVTIWAAIDLGMNLIRALLDLLGKSNSIEFCTLAQIGKICHASTVFLALDTFITFSIICIVLWTGWITHLSQGESYLWYFATTLNLISLSLVGLWTEILRFQDQEKER